MYTELQYPIFLDASQYAKDTFWKYIFEDLAYGRTPYGTYITKHFLCCNYKGKEFSYKIDSSKKPEQIYTELYDILFNKFGLLSLEDKQSLRIKFEQTQNDHIKLNNSSWSSIKKKNIKHLIIENFVSNMRKKYNLTNVQVKEILNYIIIGLIFKTITNEDIEYRNGKIYSINYFEFSKHNYKITKNIFGIDNSNTSYAASVPKKYMIDNWEKYLTSVKKIRHLNK